MRSDLNFVSVCTAALRFGRHSRRHSAKRALRILVVRGDTVGILSNQNSLQCRNPHHPHGKQVRCGRRSRVRGLARVANTTRVAKTARAAGKAPSRATAVMARVTGLLFRENLQDTRSKTPSVTIAKFSFCAQLYNTVLVPLRFRRHTPGLATISALRICLEPCSP